MNELIRALTRLAPREDGQALAEYGLILAFIFAVCVIALTALGVAISGALGSVTGGF